MTSRALDGGAEAEALRERLAEAEEMLRSIRKGEIDALVVEGATGNQVYTLHSADEPYRNLVEQMQEGALVLTGAGDILYANARFAALVGEPLESVGGSGFTRFVHPSDKGEVAMLLGAGSGRCRCKLVGLDADPFEVSVSVSTTGSIHGDRLNLVVTDLTDLLEANSSRDRAVRDSRMKDEFLATLAHELRNPLGAISTAVRVLEVTRAEGQPTSAHAVIVRQVDHITHLINGLLDIERVVSGKIRLNRQPIDMAATVRRAVATFVGDPRLDRHIDISTEPVWVDGDAVRLDQVLTNIVTNAIKYTPAGGRIRVSLRADGADAVIRVEDLGFGISAALLPFVFDMYVQGDRTLDRARGGLGIGLALVRLLVELHGGTVEAASDGDGLGSTFTVRLRQIPSPGKASAAAFAEDRRAPRRVLVIADSPAARETLRLMLESAGHVVYDTADGAGGLECLNVVRPDVTIVDLSLAVVDGYRMAKLFRESPQGRDMLLVGLVDADSPWEAKRRPTSEFDYHLVKPVDAAYLTRLISREAEAS